MAKTILLIGAGRTNSIGIAIAKRFAKKGYQTVLNYFKRHEGADILAKEFGDQVALMQGNVTDTEFLKKLVIDVLTKFGRIDSVIYCAGVTKSASYDNLDALTLDDFKHMFEVNCYAAYFVAAAVKQALIESQGSFITISSSAGISGMGSSIAYAASKGGLNTLTLSLAKALAPNVRVNAIAPSVVDSSWWDGKFPDNDKYEAFKKQIADKTALNKIVTPDDVAKLALYLAENQVTGEIIRLNAGAHVK